MRKYRGLTKDGEWVYGWYVEKEDSHSNTYSVIVFGRDFEVIPETVGQATGVKDKNGKEIYHHDYIQNKSGRICEVVWDEYSGSWDAKPVKTIQGDNPDGFICCQWISWVEIIGDIHTTPNLMEAKDG